MGFFLLLFLVRNFKSFVIFALFYTLHPRPLLGQRTARVFGVVEVLSLLNGMIGNLVALSAGHVDQQRMCSLVGQSAAIAAMTSLIV